ncbi:MAG: hypothetical protein NTU57_02680, partial [Candidatus Aenigmarchaeota archaeon]|nr:hypothetical protein [Candidatus Aenigmarchaeota archaeon]
GSSSDRDSKAFFRRGMKRIFNLDNVPDRFIDDFYKQVRCGLFHDGMTRKKVILSGSFVDAIKIEIDSISINTHKFLDKIKDDLANYLSDLRNDKNPEKDNFERVFYFGQT